MTGPGEPPRTGDAGPRCRRCLALLGPAAAVCGECGTRCGDPGGTAGHPVSLPRAWAAVPRPPSPSAPIGPGQYDRGMLTTPGTRPVGPPAAAPSPERTPSPGRRASATRPGERRPAPAVRRALASGLDALLLLLAAAPFTAGLLWMLRGEETGEGTWPAQLLIGAGTSLLCALALTMLWCQGVRGRAPGAAALGLRLVRAVDERPVGTARSLARAALFPVLLPVALLGLRRGSGVHDRLTGALLLDVRHGEDPWHPRPVPASRVPAALRLGPAAAPVLVPGSPSGGRPVLTPRPRPVETAP